MKVITLARTKELLGISGSDSDADITAKIPFIDAKVKQITGNRFNFAVFGTLTVDSATVFIRSIVTFDGNRFIWNPSSRRFFCSGINSWFCLDDIGEYLEIGQQLEGTGIPADTHIDEVFYNGVVSNFDGVNSLPSITMSDVATEASDDG